ncbi:MNIO family chryseobactin maturase [Chryseobacterium gallinarum]|uniref:DUF692 domain-containing protein n=1 Tax=Chryseobacterium gallinarum TaxID=1324352 RepID=A0ABX6KQX7_CHRGL|nr:DUF692 family multinuclear iron-containing protein [Chryseobacterium gallinarum]QIY90203.1 DUF692 domain-containing protein [Chryseobacterium gallinarum]
MEKPFLGISMMAEADFLTAILPLLRDGSIDVLEWSFDTFYHAEEPDWLTRLLNFYSQNNRLLGHGVYYSLFDAKWTERQSMWLQKLKEEVQQRKYNHITEHFGFMNTENFHQGVPLPVSLHPKTLEIGKDRLCRLQEVLEIPVGIENLAFSFSIDDVKQQGIFLEKLIEDTDGFLILDLHNIYCQACNFGLGIEEIVRLYPLEKVREIHLSGGSWQTSPYGKRRIRRDTHDDTVPAEILAVLPSVLSQCENLEYVIIERLGHTIQTETEAKDFLDDFLKVKAIIGASEWNSRHKEIKIKKKPECAGRPVEDEGLYREQTILTKLLFDNVKADHFKDFDFQYFKTENWDPEMIRTAQNIIKKWNPY